MQLGIQFINNDQSSFSASIRTGNAAKSFFVPSDSEVNGISNGVSFSVLERYRCLIRYVLPKGFSFAFLTQTQIDLLCSHINSYYRKIIDATPYFVAESYLGREILSLLHCSPVPSDEVCLTPKLLR